ncbi:MAG: phosphotransferase [Lachnospiraceae bacterium]|nr:phosphotransferase [Lachnospiraceae bacterium]
MKENIIEILKEWDIEKPEVKQIYDSAWQVGEEYVLKVYDDPDNLERNIRLISTLSGLGIPVAKLINTCQDRSYTKDTANYYILTQRLQGSPIVSNNQLEKLSYQMGRILAELHGAFLECEKQEDFGENSLLLEMKGWIKDTLEENEWEIVNKSLFEDTLLNLEKWYDNLPVQLIHRDVHFGNFLFEEEQFCGYIDFDLSQRNIRIFDLCYFLLGLLCEEETLVVTEEKWFRVLRNVFQGYMEVNKLSTQELQAVPYVMKSIELLFAAWFLGQKDMGCCKDAMKIFKFVDNNTEKILEKIVDLN